MIYDVAAEDMLPPATPPVVRIAEREREGGGRKGGRLTDACDICGWTRLHTYYPHVL